MASDKKERDRRPQESVTSKTEEATKVRDHRPMASVASKVLERAHRPVCASVTSVDYQKVQKERIENKERALRPSSASETSTTNARVLRPDSASETSKVEYKKQKVSVEAHRPKLVSVTPTSRDHVKEQKARVEVQGRAHRPTGASVTSMVNVRALRPAGASETSEAGYKKHKVSKEVHRPSLASVTPTSRRTEAEVHRPCKVSVTPGLTVSDGGPATASFKQPDQKVVAMSDDAYYQLLLSRRLDRMFEQMEAEASSASSRPVLLTPRSALQVDALRPQPLLLTPRAGAQPTKVEEEDKKEEEEESQGDDEEMDENGRETKGLQPSWMGPGRRQRKALTRKRKAEEQKMMQDQVPPWRRGS